MENKFKGTFFVFVEAPLSNSKEKSTSEADGAAKRLEELAGIIGKNQQDLEDATAIRKKEKAEHEKVVTESFFCLRGLLLIKQIKIKRLL